MTDLREKVEEDRGLIKTIQMAIPGYRGYRKREDFRIADSLLREQLADKLGGVQRTLEKARQAVSKAMEMDLLNDIGALINNVKGLEGKVRHAEQGYTGISPDHRIEEAELNRLYEYDWNLITYVKDLESGAEKVLSLAEARQFNEISGAVSEMRNSIEMFDDVFARRLERIGGLEVFA